MLVGNRPGGKACEPSRAAAAGASSTHQNLWFMCAERRALRGETIAPIGERHTSAPRADEIVARALDLGSDHTVLDMIVDQPSALHEGIHRGRSDECPALLFERLRQGERFRRGRCGLRLCEPRGVRLVAPDEGCQRALLFDKLPGASSIVDDGLDLAPMADDALILEQTVDVAPGEAREPVEVEMMKGCAEVLALGQDGAPVQSGLETLQAQLLEQAVIIADREAPFGIVIAEKFRRGCAPAAAQPAIGADDR